MASCSYGVNYVSEALSALYGLPGHFLVGLTCILFGYTLRCIRQFPNDAIPLVCILWGMLFHPLVAESPAPDASMRLWLVRNILIGLVIGAGAWVLHRYVIKTFEEKIPILGRLLTELDRQSDLVQLDKLNDNVNNYVDV